LTKNAANAQKTAIEAVQRIPEGPSPYASALQNSILTDRTKISDASKQKLDLLIGKYL